MTMNGMLQILLFLVVLILLTKPLGLYMANIYEGKSTWLLPVFGRIEQFIYRLARIKPEEGMDWKRYACAMLAFNFFGLLMVYFLS